MDQKDNLTEVLLRLPYRREVRSWLTNVSCALLGKLKPSTDYQKSERDSRVFVGAQDIQLLLESIRDIFKTHGYRTPWELEDDLIRAFRPHLPEKALEVANTYTSLDLAPDRMTGFYQKPLAPLVTGLAAFYEHVTGNPVCVLEFDYSNMRGTNNHFSKIRAAAQGQTTPETAIAGMEMTDRSARIISHTIRNDIPSEIIDASGSRRKISVIPMRVGGDELRIVAINLPMSNAKTIMEKIHHATLFPTAKLGLHNHPHHKHPGNRIHDGFGIAGTAFVLQANGKFDETVKAAETVTKAFKERRGKGLLRTHIFDIFKPPHSGDKSLYTDQVAATEHLTNVYKNMTALENDLSITGKDVQSLPGVERFARKSEKGHFLTIDQIHDALQRLLMADIRIKGIKLTPKDKQALKLKIEKFPDLDYATGVLGPRYFPTLAATALDINACIGKRSGVLLPIWTFGASFHNLGGLNDAFGHEGANVVLYHIANNIIIRSLNKIGIAKENMHIAHMGGGEFHAVIQPFIKQNPDPDERIITADKMELAQASIHSLTLEFNQKNVVDFMSRNSTKIKIEDPDLRFADIENAQQERRPWLNGIQETSFAVPYIVDKGVETHPDHRGGALTAFIDEKMKLAVNDNLERLKESYAARLLSGEPSSPFPAPGPSPA